MPRHEKLVTELSACTLGVYLIHPLMLNVFERVGLAVTPASPILSLLGVYVCLAAACFALVFILRRVPVLKRVLRVRDRVYIDKDKDNEEIPEDHLPCAAGRGRWRG